MQVSGKGVFGRFIAGQIPQIQKALERSSEKIVEQMIELAKKKYLAKRKTDKQPSNIIASFHYKQEKSSGTEVVGYFVAGGDKAPYIIYVEEYGWKTKTGRKEGYHFMRDASQEVQNEVASIVQEEFLKAFGG
jgi:hypothetical protein